MKEFKLEVAKQLNHMVSVGKEIKDLTNQELEDMVVLKAKEKAIREEVSSHEK